MQITPLIINIKKTNDDIDKAIDKLAAMSDAKEWILVGIEIGRLEELSRKMTDICKHAKDAIYADSQNYPYSNKDHLS